MLFTIAIILLLLVYALRMLFFYSGVKRELKRNIPIIRSGYEPFVSIVVPARNEEVAIEDCIISISQNDYPVDKYEIIAVNDRSEDETGKRLEKLKGSIPNLIVIHNNRTNPVQNLQGKPGALQLAITHCHGEIILMTDADCIVGKKWISSHAACFCDSSLGITAAYTDIMGKNPFSCIQAIEWIYLHSLAVGAIGWDHPLSCYGNNISLSKEKYDLIGGYKSLKFSITEDLAMLHAMHKRHFSTRHLSDPDSEIRTLANTKMKDYIRQHHRWIVGGASGLGIDAFLFVCTTIAIWSAIIVSALSGQWIMFAISFLARIILDQSAIIPPIFRLRRKDLLPWILPATIFMMCFELIAPLFLIKCDVKWKGQTFENLRRKD